MRSNKLLWGEQYERKISDLLATQREIAAEITGNLKVKMSGEDQQGPARAGGAALGDRRRIAAGMSDTSPAGLSGS